MFAGVEPTSSVLCAPIFSPAELKHNAYYYPRLAVSIIKPSDLNVDQKRIELFTLSVQGRIAKPWNMPALAPIFSLLWRRLVFQLLMDPADLYNENASKTRLSERIRTSDSLVPNQEGIATCPTPRYLASI